jgi:hypothetical protein
MSAADQVGAWIPVVLGAAVTLAIAAGLAIGVAALFVALVRYVVGGSK